MFFRSIISRVILNFIALLILGIGSFTYISLSREHSELLNEARESTRLLLGTIERSIFSSMRIGNTEDVQLTLEMVGKNHKLRSVRIFHPQGIILKSSNPHEVGRPVPDQEYQLFINNRKERVSEKGEYLTMILPIHNLEPCFPCHGRAPKVLGVLDVNYSLADTKDKMFRAARLFTVTALVIIVVLSVAISFILIRLLKRPLESLASKMSRVEGGDLSVRMKAGTDDEIGRLITSFDSMVQKLDQAKRELEQMHFEQMERADRLASVGEMSAGIAHEIKNPLTGIAGAMTIINDELPADDPRRDIIGEVLEQVKRLDKTTNDLLFFGKPTAPEFSYANINAIVEKTLWFASQHRGGKEIRKDLQLGRDLPPVHVDPKQMQQVILNLILNAVQAMTTGGTLTVRTFQETGENGRSVVVAIGDTGTGIPPQILEKIFTPFFTTKAQGTGLGLAICQKLVKQHRGVIEVESDDDGTEFRIKLPAVESLDEFMAASPLIAKEHA